MKRYETITILDPDLSEDGRKPILERIGALISEKGGTDILVDDWGSRRLAYEIKKRIRGYYIRFDYCGDGPLVNEIERFCKIDDRVLKYMTVLTDENADPDEVQKEIDGINEKAAAAEATATPREAPEEDAEPAETAVEAPEAEQPEEKDSEEKEEPDEE